MAVTSEEAARKKNSWTLIFPRLVVNRQQVFNALIFPLARLVQDEKKK